MPGTTAHTGACHIVNLPCELRVQVLDEVRSSSDAALDIRALGQSCSFFFNLFQDELYHTVVLRADSKSGRSLRRIASGPRAPVVKHLIFRARDPRPAWEQEHDTRFRLSIESKQALLFLHRFQNLAEFELDVDWKLDLWFSDHPEPRLYPVNGHSETYRVILDQTLRALGRSVHHNNARVLPKLSIRRLPPRAYRALTDHGLYALLNDLRSFHIELPDHTNWPIPSSNFRFVSNLNTYFLSHLNNVRTLHLQSSSEFLIGEGCSIPSFDFNELKMPCLRKLKLDHFVLGKDAHSFMTRHLGTLNSITLDHCSQEQDWAPLFRKIMSKKPSKLTKFEVTPRVSMAHYLEHENENSQDPESQLMMYLIHSDDRTFPRITLYCGSVWMSRNDELEELKQRHSLTAWTRLQDLIGANRQCWERFCSSRLSNREDSNT